MHAAEDAMRKETAEVRNELDNVIYQTQKQVSENGANMPVDAKQALENEITAAKQVLDKADSTKDELKAAVDKLMKVLQDNAQHMQQAQANAQAGAGAQQAQGGAAQQGGNGKGGVDADFEVVDDDNPDKK